MRARPAKLTGIALGVLLALSPASIATAQDAPGGQGAATGDVDPERLAAVRRMLAREHPKEAMEAEMGRLLLLAIDADRTKVTDEDLKTPEFQLLKLSIVKFVGAVTEIVTEFLSPTYARLLTAEDIEAIDSHYRSNPALGNAEAIYAYGVIEAFGRCSPLWPPNGAPIVADPAAIDPEKMAIARRLVEQSSGEFDIAEAGSICMAEKMQLLYATRLDQDVMADLIDFKTSALGRKYLDATQAGSQELARVFPKLLSTWVHFDGALPFNWLK